MSQAMFCHGCQSVFSARLDDGDAGEERRCAHCGSEFVEEVQGGEADGSDSDFGGEFGSDELLPLAVAPLPVSQLLLAHLRAARERAAEAGGQQLPFARTLSRAHHETESAPVGSAPDGSAQDDGGMGIDAAAAAALRRQTIEGLVDQMLRLHMLQQQQQQPLATVVVASPDLDADAAQLLPPRGLRNTLFRLFGGVGDPRDYAFGQTAIDDIVTQMMEQAAQANAPPHLTDDQIARLPHVSVRGKDLGEHPECSICQEDFSNDGDGDLAVKLSCAHHFHPDCIANWLRLNATCPVCRHPVESP